MKIKELRLQKLLSQRELAKLAGISFVSISRIESRKTKPTELTLAKLAKALGVDVKNIEW
jgi:transcriptional regulator with XRE-family HTH domain